MIHSVKTFYNWLHPKPHDSLMSTPDTQQEATIAEADAENFLYDAQENKGNVNRRVYELKAQSQRNHFAELIESTMRGMG